LPLDVKIKVRESGEFILMPQNALKLLLAILQNMTEGKSISSISTDAGISTQQAADLQIFLQRRSFVCGALFVGMIGAFEKRNIAECMLFSRKTLTFVMITLK